MPKSNQRMQSSDVEAVALSNISAQLHEILTQLDTLEGAELVALRVDEAINGLNELCGIERS